MIVGTAGHVDHGKTALIKALTGIDTDRLKEEKERGLSIELGFAYLDLPSGRRAGIVDVPGHERFVRTMLAGATGMDMALLVVAADEGVMPQTVEHLEILQLLGVQRGVVVLTKADLVDAPWLEMVRQDVEESLRGTFLEGASIVAVSSVTRQGLDELVAVMDQVAGQARERDITSPCRLPVDRVFTMAGFGTVVTGTLAHGTISAGDRLEVLPRGLHTRARSIQVHGEARQRASAGERAAVNVAGLELGEVSRGDVVAAPGIFRPTKVLDAEVNILPSAPRAVRRGARVRVHLFTAELLGRILPLGSAEIRPGEAGAVQLRLQQQTIAAPGDRLVIRSFSPMHTIGGGVVVDAHPPLRSHARRLASGASIEQVVSQAADEARRLVLDRESVAGRLGVPLERVEEAVESLVGQGLLVRLVPEGMVIQSQRYSALLDEIEGILRAFHEEEPLRLGLTHEQIRSRLSANLEPRLAQRALSDLAAQGRISRQADKFTAAGRRIEFTPAQQAVAQRIENAFLREPFAPPELDQAIRSSGAEEARQVAQALLDMGVLMTVGGITFHSRAVEQAREALVDYLRAHESITVAAFRTLLNSSRRYALPLLEMFDSAGVTRRSGDERRLGPRAGGK